MKRTAPKGEKTLIDVALGKYSAYNFPSPENALYPCPPILLLAISISLIPIVEMRTLRPEVVACISAREDVSPEARREAIWLKLWVCKFGLCICVILIELDVRFGDLAE